MLFNESFQSTNEKAPKSAVRSSRALAESRIKVFFVTHVYDLARRIAEQKHGNPAFLRAERREDGTRTFKIIAGRALRTSYGRDLYDQILGAETARSPGRPPDDQRKTAQPARLGVRHPA